MLGIGSFGLIREAVYIPQVRALQRRADAALCNDSSTGKRKILEQNQKDRAPLNEYIRSPSGEIVSIFDEPSIQTYAIKTLSKAQDNVLQSILPNEILSLVRIQQAKQVEQEYHTSNKSTHSTGRHLGEHCIRLYDVYEDAESVHLVLENCQGQSLSSLIHNADDDEEVDLERDSCSSDDD